MRIALAILVMAFIFVCHSISSVTVPNSDGMRDANIQRAALAIRAQFRN